MKDRFFVIKKVTKPFQSYLYVQPSTKNKGIYRFVLKTAYRSFVSPAKLMDRANKTGIHFQNCILIFMENYLKYYAIHNFSV